MQTMIPIRKPKKFELGIDNYKTFLNTFKIFVTAANIDGIDVIDTLLTFLDSKAQRRVGTLKLSLQQKCDVNQCYEDIGDVLQGSKMKADAKMKIYELNQKENETITDFAARLTDMADLAFESENDVKQKIMLDIFITGISSDNIAVDIIKANVDSFEKAYKKALELEGVYVSRQKKDKKKDVPLFERTDNIFHIYGQEPEDVFQVYDQQESKPQFNKINVPFAQDNIQQDADPRNSIICFLCRKNGHMMRQCTEVRCLNCKEIGHVQGECERNKQINQSNQGIRFQQYNNQLKHMGVTLMKRSLSDPNINKKFEPGWQNQEKNQFGQLGWQNQNRNQFGQSGWQNQNRNQFGQPGRQNQGRNQFGQTGWQNQGRNQFSENQFGQGNQNRNQFGQQNQGFGQENFERRTEKPSAKEAVVQT